MCARRSPSLSGAAAVVARGARGRAFLRDAIASDIAGEHEVDRLTDGQDLGRFLVGDLQLVGCLRPLDQRVEIERVGFEVLPKAARLGDRLRWKIELVRQMRPNERE